MRRVLGWCAVGCLAAVTGCGDGGGTTTAGSLAQAVSIDAAVDVSLAEADFVPVSDPVPVEVGDVVRTDGSGFAEVVYHDGSLTRLDINTKLVVLALADDDGGSTVRTEMGVGRTWNRVEQLAEDDEFVVETSVATATVRGTAFIIECPDDASCTFTVLEGTVELGLPDGTTVDLVAPSEVTVSADGAEGDPTPVDPEETLASDDWLARNADLDVDEGFAAPDELAAPEDSGGTVDEEVCVALVQLVDAADSPFDAEAAVAAAPSDDVIASLPPAVRSGVEEMVTLIDQLVENLAPGGPVDAVQYFRAHFVAPDSVMDFLAAECAGVAGVELPAAPQGPVSGGS